ncbi:hypothetical protein JOQ06_013127 [Pogonophryne albipinna]|uniref:BED-type domain-containing protein n=1 Tax=Pogonophryne albipinna TaxID=1090488 RepID=A0AAD6FR05_9TELE|nr:hypothetical protein JOQ06_013127 [Pogonophryne albipinna]
MNGGRRSKVWIHFVRKDNGSAECNTCSKLISFKGGTTTNMTKHLCLHGIQIKECTVFNLSPVSVRLTTTVVFRCRPGSTNTEHSLSGALAIR